MTRAELLTAFGYELNKAASMDATTQARALVYINQAQRMLLSTPGLQHLRQFTTTVASVASQAFYGLAGVARVDRIWDATERRYLLPLSISQYRMYDPGSLTITGRPTHFVWSGFGATAKQPSDASRLFWLSTEAADTMSGYVEGMTTGGFSRLQTRALTGTTAVDVNTAITTWIDVSKAYLASVPTGVVTLLEDSGIGTELARIGIGTTQTRYWQFYLWRTPGEVITYTLDGLREITDLAQSTDEPILPPEWHDLIFLSAAKSELRHLDDARYAVVSQEYRERKADFDLWLHETAAGMTPTAKIEPPSRLGAWFPSGT